MFASVKMFKNLVEMVSESQSDPTFIKRTTGDESSVSEFATKRNQQSFERCFECRGTLRVPWIEPISYLSIFVYRKRLKMWTDSSWLLHENNAPLHRIPSFSVPPNQRWNHGSPLCWGTRDAWMTRSCICFLFPPFDIKSL